MNFYKCIIISFRIQFINIQNKIGMVWKSVLTEVIPLIRAGIIGSTGYAGQMLSWILHNHLRWI